MPEANCPRVASSAEGARECCRNDIRQNSPCFESLNLGYEYQQLETEGSAIPASVEPELAVGCTAGLVRVAARFGYEGRPQPIGGTPRTIHSESVDLANVPSLDIACRVRIARTAVDQQSPTCGA